MASQISKIKQARRSINIFSTPIQAILASESKAQSIQSKSNDDLIEETQVLLDIRTPFVRAYNTLLKEHEHFEELQPDSAAKQQLHQYYKANGDYLQELSNASDLLQTLDNTIEQYISEGQSRDLPMPERNDDALTTTTQQSMQRFHRPIPAKRNSLSTPTPNEQQTDANSTLIEHPNEHNSDNKNVVYVQNDATNAFVTASLIGTTLPEFSVDILQWPEFFESFSCLIRHGNITGADKLTLLRMCLKDEALEIISGFSRIDRNYDHAIVLLRKEYDRPHLRHHALLSKLRNLPQCDREGNNLRSLYLQLNVIIRQLLPNGELDSPDLLMNLIISKLPIQMQTRIIKETARKQHFGVFQVLSIIADAVDDERIEREIMANDSIDTLSSSRPSTPDNPLPEQSPSISRYTDHQTRSCRLCDGSHFEQHCTEYITQEDRRIAVKQRQLCANCFKQGHVATECRNHGRCHHCKNRHHTSLCTSVPPSSAQSAFPTTISNQ